MKKQNTKYKIAICDQDKITHQKIRKEIISQNLDGEYNIDSYYNALDFLNSYKQYDIIFISVELKDVNGLNVANQLRYNGNKAFIIFLSYDNGFIREAFKVSAFRYLIKPIKKDELYEALKSIDKIILESNNSIVINSNNKIMRVLKDDIIYIESYGDGSYIYILDSYIETKLSLKYLISQLGEKFFQVHKSYIVSLKYVKKINDHELIMNNTNNTIPISYRRYSEFKKSFLNYIPNRSFIFCNELPVFYR